MGTIWNRLFSSGKDDVRTDKISHQTEHIYNPLQGNYDPISSYKRNCLKLWL